MELSVRCVFAICCLFAVAGAESSDEDTTTTPLPTTTTSTTSTSLPSRSGRKLYEQSYDAQDQPYDGVHYGLDGYGLVSPRSLANKKYVVPYKHAASGVMKKSGANVNWSVWKGDEEDSGDESRDKEDGPKWPVAPTQWSNEPWMTDPMYMLMLKNAMAEIKGETKPQGFLSKIGSDPALLLIAASIPISLLLAAVVPAVMNLVMNGSNVPTVTTTATGTTKARNHQTDVLPYLAPVMEAIGTFGIRSIGNPDCMQRIFCQVAQDKFPLHESRYLRKAVSIARYLADGNWLEGFGVKNLVDSLGSGSCENIPCTHHTKTENSRSRYSRKLMENELKI